MGSYLQVLSTIYKIIGFKGLHLYRLSAVAPEVKNRYYRIIARYGSVYCVTSPVKVARLTRLTWLGSRGVDIGCVYTWKVPDDELQRWFNSGKPIMTITPIPIQNKK